MSPAEFMEEYEEEKIKAVCAEKNRAHKFRGKAFLRLCADNMYSTLNSLR